jgi:hypothetical protein
MVVERTLPVLERVSRLLATSSPLETLEVRYNHRLRANVIDHIWLSYKERTVDTLATTADEGRSKLRKATRSRYRLRSVGLRMGQPHRG